MHEKMQRLIQFSRFIIDSRESGFVLETQETNGEKKEEGT